MGDPVSLWNSTLKPRDAVGQGLKEALLADPNRHFFDSRPGFRVIQSTNHTTPRPSYLADNEGTVRLWNNGGTKDHEQTQFLTKKGNDFSKINRLILDAAKNNITDDGGVPIGGFNDIGIVPKIRGRPYLFTGYDPIPQKNQAAPDTTYRGGIDERKNPKPEDKPGFEKYTSQKPPRRGPDAPIYNPSDAPDDLPPPPPNTLITYKYPQWNIIQQVVKNKPDQEDKYDDKYDDEGPPSQPPPPSPQRIGNLGNANDVIMTETIRNVEDVVMGGNNGNDDQGGSGAIQEEKLQVPAVLPTDVPIGVIPSIPVTPIRFISDADLAATPFVPPSQPPQPPPSGGVAILASKPLDLNWEESKSFEQEYQRLQANLILIAENDQPTSTLSGQLYQVQQSLERMNRLALDMEKSKKNLTLESTEKLNRQLMQKLEHMTAQLDETKKVLAGQTAKERTLEQVESTLRSEIVTLKSKLGIAGNVNQANKENIKRLERSMNEMETKMREMENTPKSTVEQAEINDLKSKMQQKEKLLEKLEKEKRAAMNEISQANDAIQSKTNEITLLGLKMKDADIDSKKAMDEIRANMVRTQASLKEAQEEVKKAQSEKQTELNDIQRELQERRNELDRLQQELEASRVNVLTERGVNQRLRSSENALLNTQFELTQRITNLEARLNVVGEENTALRQREYALMSEGTGLTGRLQQALEDRQNLENILKNAEVQHAALLKTYSDTAQWTEYFLGQSKEWENKAGLLAENFRIVEETMNQMMAERTSSLVTESKEDDDVVNQVKKRYHELGKVIANHESVVNQWDILGTGLMRGFIHKVVTTVGEAVLPNFASSQVLTLEVMKEADEYVSSRTKINLGLPHAQRQRVVTIMKMLADGKTIGSGSSHNSKYLAHVLQEYGRIAFGDYPRSFIAAFEVLGYTTRNNDEAIQDLFRFACYLDAESVIQFQMNDALHQDTPTPQTTRSGYSTAPQARSWGDPYETTLQTAPIRSNVVGEENTARTSTPLASTASIPLASTASIPIVQPTAYGYSTGVQSDNWQDPFDSEMQLFDDTRTTSLGASARKAKEDAEAQRKKQETALKAFRKAGKSKTSKTLGLASNVRSQEASTSNVIPQGASSFTLTPQAAAFVNNPIRTLPLNNPAGSSTAATPSILAGDYLPNILENAVFFPSVEARTNPLNFSMDIDMMEEKGSPLAESSPTSVAAQSSPVEQSMELDLVAPVPDYVSAQQKELAKFERPSRRMTEIGPRQLMSEMAKAQKPPDPFGKPPSPSNRSYLSTTTADYEVDTVAGSILGDDEQSVDSWFRWG